MPPVRERLRNHSTISVAPCCAADLLGPRTKVEVVDGETYRESVVAPLGIDLVSTHVPRPVVTNPGSVAVCPYGSEINGFIISNPGLNLAFPIIGAKEYFDGRGPFQVRDCEVTGCATGVFVTSFRFGGETIIEDFLFVNDLFAVTTDELAGGDSDSS